MVFRGYGQVILRPRGPGPGARDLEEQVSTRPSLPAVIGSGLILSHSEMPLPAGFVQGALYTLHELFCSMGCSPHEPIGERATSARPQTRNQEPSEKGRPDGGRRQDGDGGHQPLPVPI